MKPRFLLLLIFFISILSPEIQSQTLGDQARISILTCNPGTEVYSMYGHTAIRVNDPEQGIDVVFNYGVFSFETPNFLYRFAKGQTDYLMVGQKFSSFIPEYEADKRSVYEQILNLSSAGKNQLFQALIENAKPENREYRYNFFMDNCATRVRDMIERNSGSNISFPELQPTESYRGLIKAYHHSFRWIDLGIDLLVGKKAEQSVSAYGQMFLPEYLQKQFSQATISTDSGKQPLVSETHTLVEFPNAKLNSNLPWPGLVFGFIFILVLAFSIWAYAQKKSIRWIDYWLFAASGLAGLIIGWFTLFSEHPAMSPNYNLLWANPLNLFFVLILANKKRIKLVRYYLALYAVLLLVAFFIGQQFNPAVYFIVLLMLVRVLVNLIPLR